MTLNLKTQALFSALVLSTSLVSGLAFAADSVKEDAKEAGQTVKRDAKKAGRKVQDETCEMVNGKTQCAAKKVKHSLQNTGDEIKDKVN